MGSDLSQILSVFLISFHFITFKLELSCAVLLWIMHTRFLSHLNRGFKICCLKGERTDEENTVNTDIKKDLRELGKIK